MRTYFIGGLGCNAFYPQEFFTYFSFPIEYLDVYGADITSLKDLEEWFLGKIASEDVLLIAHSLGGDLAVYLVNHCPSVKGLILLDGGYMDMESICSLEEELAGVQDYLTAYRFSTLEQAVAQEKASSTTWSPQLEEAVLAGLVWDEESQFWTSNLSFDTIKSLLSIRRQLQGEIQKIEVPSLLLIPQLSEATPPFVSHSLTSLPASIKLVEIEHASHDLYLERPEVVAKTVQAFLSASSLSTTFNLL